MKFVDDDDDDDFQSVILQSRKFIYPLAFTCNSFYSNFSSRTAPCPFSFQRNSHGNNDKRLLHCVDAPAESCRSVDSRARRWRIQEHRRPQRMTSSSRWDPPTMGIRSHRTLQARVVSTRTVTDTVHDTRWLKCKVRDVERYIQVWVTVSGHVPFTSIVTIWMNECDLSDAITDTVAGSLNKIKF